MSLFNKSLLNIALLAISPVAWSANVLINPGFESAIINDASWVSFGGSFPIATSTEAKHAGNYAALISGRSAYYVGIAQNILNLVKANEGHDVRIWVRTRQNVPATYSLGIKIIDGTGTPKYINLDSRSVAPGKWVKLGGYYKHQPVGETTLLQMYVNGPAAGIDFFVDDARLEPPLSYRPNGGAATAATDYVRAAGRQLVVGADAKPIRLLGTNFFAYGEDHEPADSVLGTKKFDREDYAAVKKAGMNTVRLNAWYRLFEEDATPYVYKQEGWDWLNKQIIWARNAGVRIILDMHAPQCGIQGPDYSGQFWSGGNAYGSCQDRLKALWVEIARRYKNEPVIASYDLLNEPKPANQAAWASYAQSLIDAIRSQDANHLVQVESCFAADCTHPPLMSDGNVLYDFHHYDHWLHSSQMSYNGNLGDSNMRYGDATSLALPWRNDYTPSTLLENHPIPTGSSDWKLYHGKKFTLLANNVIAAIPVFISTKNSGKVSFDDFKIREYDPTGKLVRVIQDIDMEKSPKNPFLLETYTPYLSFTQKTTTQRLSGDSGSKIIENSGHRGDASVSISNANGKFLVKMPNLTFAMRKGYSYQISGWMKATHATGGTGAMGFQLQKNKAYVVPKAYDRAYLEKSLLDYGFQFSLNHNVPINLGEYGQSLRNYTAARGGLAWMKDTLELMEQYGASGQNWDWHSTLWGLYGNLYGYPDAQAVNAPLLQLFRAQNTGE